MSRKKLIEEIVAGFHALRNRVHGSSFAPKGAGRTTNAQWFVLSLIGESKSRGIKDIAEIIGISPSAATQLVDGLARDHLVVRTPDARDRRALRLLLSPAGRRRIALMKKKFLGRITVLFDALTDRELHGYLRLQKKILDHNSRKV